jgi:uncharacterized protein YjbJ (UPF0337 family)
LPKRVPKKNSRLVRLFSLWLGYVRARTEPSVKLSYDGHTVIAKESTMNSNQVNGKLQDIGGKIQEEAGKLVGSDEQQVKGLKNQVEGKTQEKLGDAQEKIHDATR